MLKKFLARLKFSIWQPESHFLNLLVNIFRVGFFLHPKYVIQKIRTPLYYTIHSGFKWIPFLTFHTKTLHNSSRTHLYGVELGYTEVN